MAKTYTALTSIATGDVLTATNYNNLQTNSNNFRVPASCQVARTTNLTGYTNDSDISWSSASYDTGTADSPSDPMFSAGSPTRITIRTTGLYLVQCHAYLSATATITQMNISWNVNGRAGVTGITSIIARSSVLAYGVLSSVYRFTAGDYITMQLNVSGGSAYVVNGSATEDFTQSRFSATWLGQVS